MRQAAAAVATQVKHPPSTMVGPAPRIAQAAATYTCPKLFALMAANECPADARPCKCFGVDTPTMVFRTVIPTASAAPAPNTARAESHHAGKVPKATQKAPYKTVAPRTWRPLNWSAFIQNVIKLPNIPPA
ncbi:unnamed protein product [Prorocentrum cordatum]|uniref:Uncharacterized protein n=1 Tax=Prorocentrum cordatum TaxID=2364126 RepID=A0ABN9Y7D4_9DINO|nr:unnamed protein product [Polarella glacialis]